jgi:hypothetical protein
MSEAVCGLGASVVLRQIGIPERMPSIVGPGGGSERSQGTTTIGTTD